MNYNEYIKKRKTRKSYIIFMIFLIFKELFTCKIFISNRNQVWLKMLHLCSSRSCLINEWLLKIRKNIQFILKECNEVILFFNKNTFQTTTLKLIHVFESHEIKCNNYWKIFESFFLLNWFLKCLQVVKRKVCLKRGNCLFNCDKKQFTSDINRTKVWGHLVRDGIWTYCIRLCMLMKSYTEQ
jgi:hypothetical protein